MGFPNGSISYRRFHVSKKRKEGVTQELLDQIKQHVISNDEIVSTDELTWGWTGPQHLLDTNISFENSAYNDCLFIALRIDTNKVPGQTKKAMTAVEEQILASGNPSGFISKAQKREVKDIVRRKLDDELRSGKYRRSKHIPMLWDLVNGIVYANVSGSSYERFAEIFERTFGEALTPMNAETLTIFCANKSPEDLTPSRFRLGSEGEAKYPDYPWVSKSKWPKVFLGNEFLLWLWWHCETESGDLGTSHEVYHNISFFFDKQVKTQCAYGENGSDTFTGTGPHKMPEARHSISTGKVPRKAGLIIHSKGDQFSFMIDPENFAIGAMKLPDVEDVDTARVMFEERINLLRTGNEILDALYKEFIIDRTSPEWMQRVIAIGTYFDYEFEPTTAR